MISKGEHGFRLYIFIRTFLRSLHNGFIFTLLPTLNWYFFNTAFYLFKKYNESRTEFITKDENGARYLCSCTFRIRLNSLTVKWIRFRIIIYGYLNDTHFSTDFHQYVYQFLGKRNAVFSWLIKVNTFSGVYTFLEVLFCVHAIMDSFLHYFYSWYFFNTGLCLFKYNERRTQFATVSGIYTFWEVIFYVHAKNGFIFKSFPIFKWYSHHNNTYFIKSKSKQLC